MHIHKARSSLLTGACASLVAMAACPAHAGVVTTAAFAGSATTTNADGQSFTETYTTSGTDESFQTTTPGQEISRAQVIGTIETRSDGQLNFANTVGGVGLQSSASSKTLIRQVITNDTGSVQDVNFASLILPGAIGLGLFDTTQCFSNTSLFDCEEASTTRPVDERGGPASAGLNVQVVANGTVAFELDIMVGVTEPIGGSGSYQEDVADGSALTGFGLLGDPADNNSLFYAWDETNFSVALGELGIGEELVVEFFVETTFTNETTCSFETTCVSALSGFGDPIKTAGNVQTFALRSFAVALAIMPEPVISFASAPPVTPDPVPVPAAAWLMMAALGGTKLFRRGQAIAR